MRTLEQARRDRERDKRRRRRQRQRLLSPETYLRMGGRALRRHLRRLTAPQRRALRRKMRKARYKLRKRAFGPCPTCGMAGGPGHTCKMRFGAHNAARLRRRMEKRGMPETPLWRGRQAA